MDAATGSFGSELEFQLNTTGDMMMKLIALTMMCDANRSIILQMPGFVKYNFLNNQQAADYDHHGLSRTATAVPPLVVPAFRASWTPSPPSTTTWLHAT